MAEQTFRVTGMTCGHCVTSVTNELSALNGVHNVEVNLESGEVRVTSDTLIDQQVIAAAITEAGYELAE